MKLKTVLHLGTGQQRNKFTGNCPNALRGLVKAVRRQSLANRSFV
jgi:hypothetical protein